MKLDFPICNFSVASYLNSVPATDTETATAFPLWSLHKESQEAVTSGNYTKILIWTSASFRGEEGFQILSKLTWKDNGTGLFFDHISHGITSWSKTLLVLTCHYRLKGDKNSRESADFLWVQTALQVLFLDKNYDKKLHSKLCLSYLKDSTTISSVCPCTPLQ